MYRCRILDNYIDSKQYPLFMAREIMRIAQDGCYASQVASTCTRLRRRSESTANKLHAEGLFGVMHHFFNHRWSPEQIALTLVSLYRKGHEFCVSTESIYNGTYAQPVGLLKKNLIQAFAMYATNVYPEAKDKTGVGRFQTCSAWHTPCSTA